MGTYITMARNVHAPFCNGHVAQVRFRYIQRKPSIVGIIRDGIRNAYAIPRCWLTLGQEEIVKKKVRVMTSIPVAIRIFS
jgi:hypothetical protein